MHCNNALFFSGVLTTSAAGLPFGAQACCALLPSPFRVFNAEGCDDVIGDAC
ncbi:MULTISPECIES: hypothetical protein [unclassified Symbiopectobacterium]|uniref:hypothetical protein n=1 Tax=unclassified Symbiopectobacterium TaxID=2794573 RepID=UPI002227359C|nr:MULTISPECIES: hypothetical protein [unclassified Symbiopectobacterium]MCW2476036.1 hypothetical protein [Candidatus Symbiopectobacterium sp. NZEC151]MCW2483800.1 hypothetical protein [Candidatus Symbiopectobacterium sp. NZEC135]MCW2487042.1 hypothetical protein [Candidatus Symbiopectobacterium sp. NZEC127]